ncbi:hypothetical protein GCM10020227_44750 [Streptomyces flavovirens]
MSGAREGDAAPDGALTVHQPRSVVCEAVGRLRPSLRREPEDDARDWRLGTPHARKWSPGEMPVPAEPYVS